MAAILLWASVTSTACLILGVATFALRRLRLIRRTRRRLVLERRVHRTALAVVDGVKPPLLAAAERPILEDIVLRYSRWVEEDGRRAFAAFFTAGGRVAAELKRLQSRRSWRRAAAATVLGSTAADEALLPLVSALHDPVRDVRAAAARALGRLGEPRAVRPLTNALADGSVPEGVVAQALLAIGPAALGPLHRLLRSPDSRLRCLAVEIAGYMGGPFEEHAAVALLADPSADVRARAATALGRLAAVDGTAELLALLADRVPFVRAAAAEALGAVGDVASLPDLIELAAGDDHASARSAALAVGRIDPQALARAATRGPHLRAAADLLEVAA